MSVACEIEVKSPVFGSIDRQLPLPAVGLHWMSTRITVRELIALTVEAQINLLLDEHSEIPEGASLRIAKHYLSAKDIEEQALTGKIGLPAPISNPSGIDISLAITKTQSAFEKGIFKIAIDGKFVSSLDEIIPLTPKTPATFIRLMPLVGG